MQNIQSGSFRGASWRMERQTDWNTLRLGSTNQRQIIKPGSGNKPDAELKTEPTQEEVNLRR
jgi:hypothetical protein